MNNQQTATLDAPNPEIVGRKKSPFQWHFYRAWTAPATNLSSAPVDQKWVPDEWLWLIPMGSFLQTTTSSKKDPVLKLLYRTFIGPSALFACCLPLLSPHQLRRDGQNNWRWLWRPLHQHWK